ncbi:MAG: 2-amino-4-hydroxy-6-hydroxymethyldihydropteridine diphosphokinase [Deltaproteobacteria bacterium]|nr:2-amino-4-hydroxy-6-hydroxymethyldihydropteridine diphosphokinase [Deltaproteobacteria bacterium]
MGFHHSDHGFPTEVKRVTAYIGIGSNLGDSLKHCHVAVDRIERLPGCRVIRVSDWYHTRPVGVIEQDWYVNGAVALDVEVEARILLTRLLAIEREMGRVRVEKWGPRVIDLDILLYGDQVIREEGLEVPHPLMHLRRFVLVPLADIAPEVVHPFFNITVRELLDRLAEDGQEVLPLNGRVQEVRGMSG